MKMNIARKICTIRPQIVCAHFHRNFRFSATNYESSEATQPKVKEEKYDFEDLKVFERTEHRKPKIAPFMKNVFVSIYDRELLAYPEIINKEDSEALEKRSGELQRVFCDTNKTKEDRKAALKSAKMYAAPVNLTNNGLAINITESLRYLDVISQDPDLGQEVADHWVALRALKLGLTAEQFQQIVDDLVTGEHPISLCVKERLAERITQADFSTTAELDGQGIWRITGEKVCHHAAGYLLVLAAVEANRLQAFLIHPNIQGVSFKDNFVIFKKTPATPLNQITEGELSHVLGLSRLYAATLCRAGVKRAIDFTTNYVRSRVYSGKPLSKASTIQAAVGETLLDIYASESAEYFTAGLLDGYEDPDAELEMAMCRNFMSVHGVTTLMKLLSIPALEQEQECDQLLNDVRHLAVCGESLDAVKMFIALNGIHHAGKAMADEIKQIRNPLYHPGFIIKKVLANRHQEKDSPILNLFLAEHLHPSLRPPAEQLEYCVLRMRYACETLMSRHGVDVASAYTELSRLAEAATEILVMTATLARASRSYCIGVRNAELEMKLSACFVNQSKDKVKKLILEIDEGEYLNLDHFKVQFGKRVLENVEAVNPSIVELPTARVFW